MTADVEAFIFRLTAVTCPPTTRGSYLCGALPSPVEGSFPGQLETLCPDTIVRGGHTQYPTMSLRAPVICLSAREQKGHSYASCTGTKEREEATGDPVCSLRSFLISFA